MRSRAISRTILAAEKTFFLRLRGMVVTLASGISSLRQENGARPLLEGHPHLRTFSAQKCNNLKLAKSSWNSKPRTQFMDEREFFDERSDKKPANLSCPHCHQSAEYEIQWLVRMKKKSLPPRSDDRDRAKFAKAQSYMLRRDDAMMCKNLRCRKRFEITSVQSVAFLD